jgi:hypothetical protein
VGGVVARSLARVGACADELRLMGEERAEVYTLAGRVGGGRGSLCKVSRACGPPALGRMWSGPWGDGANCTTQGVVSGGRRWPYLCYAVFYTYLSLSTSAIS